MFEIKRKLNILKRLAIVSLLVVLFTIKVSALPLSMTFGESHDASFFFQNGEVFLSLEHRHEHQHHHLNSNHDHETRAASIFNGHDGAHTDHLIKISNSDSDLMINNLLKQIPEFKITLINDILVPKLETASVESVSVTVLYRDKNDISLRKHSVQFLV